MFGVLAAGMSQQIEAFKVRRLEWFLIQEPSEHGALIVQNCDSESPLDDGVNDELVRVVRQLAQLPA